ncbi:MAG TPA: 30S ribosomal protein S20 [Candidatus Saccharimonadales bacterium]|nr:30S ribosomal protein S20 [Candidatus Saccharimonadales bacterium]
MPIIKSAKKRVRAARKATVRNAKTKRTLKTALKSFNKSLTGDSHSKAQSALDKAVKKGLVHKNKAARTKSRLAKQAKAAGAKAKTSAKEATTPKKTVAKKPTTKKPAARKTTKK